MHMYYSIAKIKTSEDRARSAQIHIIVNVWRYIIRLPTRNGVFSSKILKIACVYFVL